MVARAWTTSRCRQSAVVKWCLHDAALHLLQNLPAPAYPLTTSGESQGHGEEIQGHGTSEWTRLVSVHDKAVQATGYTINHCEATTTV